MIHPNTQLKFINDQIGYGVFATSDILKGTIVYVKDALESEISEEVFSSYPQALQEVIEKYSYIDERGLRIVSWDHAKYVNHCCHCNTMSTGYGFEIAIRDIKAGEEITDEYGMFNLAYEMQLYCGFSDCRRCIRPGDLESFFQQWDVQILPALDLVFSNPQPLLGLLDSEVVEALHTFRRDRSAYRSVRKLRAPSTGPLPSA